jgi:hypothetical protein
LPGVPFVWSASGNATVDSTSGWVFAIRPGPADVTATTVSGVAGSIRLAIDQPDSFPGTIEPASGPPGTIVTVKSPHAINPRLPTWAWYEAEPIRLVEDADSLVFVVPFVRWNDEFRFTIETDDFAVDEVFPYTTKTPVDPYEPNDDPLTAPPLPDGYHVIALTGDCIAGESSNPGDDCSDFFTVANTGADSASVTVIATWDADFSVNMFWTDELFTQTVGDSDEAEAGQTQSEVMVPPLTTWRLWISVLDSHYRYDRTAVVLLEVHGVP